MFVFNFSLLLLVLALLLWIELNGSGICRGRSKRGEYNIGVRSNMVRESCQICCSFSAPLSFCSRLDTRTLASCLLVLPCSLSLRRLTLVALPLVVAVDIFLPRLNLRDPESTFVAPQGFSFSSAAYTFDIVTIASSVPPPRIASPPRCLVLFSLFLYLSWCISPFLRAKQQQESKEEK